MSVYWKSIGWHIVAVSAVASAVLCAAFGNLVLKLPPTMTFTLPIRIVGPAIPAIMISYVLGKGDPQRKLLATRSVRWLDMAIYLGTLFLTFLAYVLVKNSALDFLDLAVLRNTVSLTGLAVLSSHVFGKGRNWTLPLGLTLTTMVAGVDIQNRPFSWAWLLQPYDDALAFGFSALILFIALAVCFFDYERH